MAKNIRMDSHKLIYHPERVARWLKGELIYPLEVEIGLSGACNHRCIFCAVDYMEYKPHILESEALIPNLKIMAEKGIKSIIYAGEGEPFVHPAAPEIIRKTKEYGIDVAVSTNGVLFTPDKASECLSALSWIRFSIAGATSATYEKIHQCKSGDLQLALSNMSVAAKIKSEKKLSVTLGAQLILLPENKDEVVLLAKTIRDIGFDYFTVKPFSKHPSSKAKLLVDYSATEEIGRQLKKYETENFRIYFRSRSIENLKNRKVYQECAGMNFMTYMDAKGNVYPCIVFMGRNEFVYGNIHDNTFSELWESERADKIRAMFTDEFIQCNCRKACRLDEINKYLHELKHPGEHVNFI